MKPSLPDYPTTQWPLIEVDTSDDSPFDRIRRIADGAAVHWYLSDEGPYAKPGMSNADATAGAVREALLHLLELGLVDIDIERVSGMSWWPVSRSDTGARKR